MKHTERNISDTVCVCGTKRIELFFRVESGSVSFVILNILVFVGFGDSARVTAKRRENTKRCPTVLSILSANPHPGRVFCDDGPPAQVRFQDARYVTSPYVSPGSNESSHSPTLRP